MTLTYKVLKVLEVYLHTSTMLKRISDEKVANVASSNTLGRTTSLRYARRYVWWILARSAGSEIGTTSLKMTFSLKKSL